MLLVKDTDQELAQRLAEELAGVESRFAAELVSDLACVNRLTSHVERYRGKMLRPMLVLVSGMAAAPNRENLSPSDKSELLTDDHRTVATVVEMVHMATLVHDDILDEASVRRRGATVNQLDGNETAVMLGDYLISHAYHLCSSITRKVGPADDARFVSRIIADTTNTVCEGELLQLANRNRWDLDEGTYFEIIRRKTASLCAVCCRMGALLHACSPDVVDGLAAYGEKVGVAFQIVDDLLDLTGNQETVGKTLGMDLHKGKLTLPLIHYLQQADDGSRASFFSLLRECGVEPRHNGHQPTNGRDRPETRLQDFSPERANAEASSYSKILSRLRDAGSLDYARARARELIHEAKSSLASLADSPARSLLLEMADKVIARDR